jgi:hypothetical protein
VTLQDGRVVPAVTKLGILGNQVIDESEACEIRRVATEVLAGVSMASIIRDLNERGVVSTKGNQWSAFTLKQVLLNPRLAGFRVHRGEIMVDPKTQEFVRGLWDPILDVETYSALEDKLLEQSQEGRSEAHRQYLLSGILRCWECQGPLHGNARSEVHFYYACKSRGYSNGRVGCGKVSVSGVAVDELIVAALKARMPTDIGDLPDQGTWPREHEITAVQGKIKTLVREFPDAQGDLGPRILAELTALNEKAEDLRLERNKWVRARSAAQKRVAVGPETWDQLTLAERRAYASAELSAIYVRPATKRGNRLDPARLAPVWRDLEADAS